MAYQKLTIEENLSKQSDFRLRGFFNEQMDMPPHQQEFTEIVFILNGRAEHYTPTGDWKPIQRGDIWVIPSQGIHGFRNTENLKIFNLLFAMNYLPIPLLDLYTHPGYKHLFLYPSNPDFSVPYPHLHTTRQNMQKFESLLNCFTHFDTNLDGRVHNSAIYGIFMAIISFLCDLAVEDAKEERSPLDFQKINLFIQEHYADNITLAQLCKLSMMSESSFRRHFHQTFGMTPVEYIMQIRLTAASQLLLTSTLSVKEISGRTGFNDESYFIRTFRKTYHCSPQEYRKKLL
jgi:AraC-like DNA-binding protein